MPERHFAAAAQRNAAPILEVLQSEFAACRRVLEIGSGTGQHAVTIAAALPYLTWQPSDVPENCAGIQAWIADAQIATVLPPLPLDVCRDDVGEARFDAAFSANTAHIMGIDAVEKMFTLTANALDPGGVMCVYSPFRIGGEVNSPSNAAFDASLRQRSATMGIRDLEALDAFAAEGGMVRRRLYAMPANNYIAVWQKGNSCGDA